MLLTDLVVRTVPPNLDYFCFFVILKVKIKWNSKPRETRFKFQTFQNLQPGVLKFWLLYSSFVIMLFSETIYRSEKVEGSFALNFWNFLASLNTRWFVSFLNFATLWHWKNTSTKVFEWKIHNRIHIQANIHLYINSTELLSILKIYKLIISIAPQMMSFALPIRLLTPLWIFQ